MSNIAKKQTLERLGYASYADYLAGPHWKAIKARLLNFAQRCPVCENDTTRILHHITYARLGAEHDSDFLHVCEDCHNMIHRELDRHYLGRSVEYKVTRTMTIVRGIQLGRIQPARKQPRRPLYKKRKANPTTSRLPEEQALVDALRDPHEALLESVRSGKTSQPYSHDQQRSAATARTKAKAGQTVALHNRVKSVVSRKAV